MNGRRLYDEIGGVDERYLQQAATYRARRKAPVWRTVLIAAALMLAGTLLLGTLAMSTGVILLGSWIFGDNENPDDLPAAPDVNEQIEPYTLERMEQTMAEQEAFMQPLAEDSLQLFVGTPQLIWTDGESGEYYRVYLSENECGNMLKLMREHQVEINASSEQPGYQLWIALGDGTVVSPYLKTAAGNAGHGELFTYDPEVEISEDLIRLIMYCIEA